LRPRLALAAALGAAAAALAPAGASAAEFQPCAGPRLECATISVPLDRAGAVPGTVGLRIVRSRPFSPERPTLLALAGGPGQGGVAAGRAFTQLYAPALARGYQLVALDQRGTGAADPVDCPSLQRLALSDLTVAPPRAVEACSARLGPRRAFYATTDTVADLEAVRTELGVARWAIAGISYGTYVAERYARAHPERVERLVLDSVVPQEDVDPFMRPTLRATARVLRGLCAGGRCRRFTRDPAADLAALVRRLAAGPVTAPLVTRSGRRTRAALADGPALLDLLVSGSFVPAVQARFPAAIAAARRGDGAPLVRLQALIRPANRSALGELSQGLHAATLCADLASTPWGGAAAPAEGRAVALRSATAGLAPGELRPFDRATAAGNGLMQTCLRWGPTPVTPPPAPGPLPDVPTLVAAGAWDLSTPLEDAERELARASHGELVVVPRAGHNVIDRRRCITDALDLFFAGQPVGDPCRGRSARSRLAGRPVAVAARQPARAGSASSTPTAASTSGRAAISPPIARAVEAKAGSSSTRATARGSSSNASGAGGAIPPRPLPAASWTSRPAPTSATRRALAH